MRRRDHPSRPTRATFAAATAAVAVALAGCGGTVPTDHGSQDPGVVVGGSTAPAHNGVPAPSRSLGTVVDIPVPASIRHLPLATADGKTVTLSDYAGTPVMLTDFLTLCTDVCPMISANTAATARQLATDGAAGQVKLLEVTVDPQRDTTARLRKYQALYGGPQPDWTLARTTPGDTRRFWQFFRVYYERKKERSPDAVDWLTHQRLTYDVAHSDALLFMDGRGHIRFVVDGGPDTQGRRPPARLLHFLDGEGRRNLRHPDPTDSWTPAQAIGVFSWLLGRRLPAR